MGVEILILSGARQGDRLVLDADEFRAGGVEACDVFFDPAADAAAMGRIALFRRSDEGWSIQNAGKGELLLNQENVSGRTRIRSGDIVRLSDRGPDFSFAILAARPAAWSDSPAEESAPPPSGHEAPSALHVDDVLASGVTAESNLAPVVLPKRSRRRNLVIAAVAGVCVLALLVFRVVINLGPVADDSASVAVANNPVVRNNAAIEPDQPTDHKVEASDVAPPKPTPDQQQTTNTTQNSTQNTTPPDAPSTPPGNPAAPTPADPWTQIARQYEKTVWLLEVGDPAGKFVYPFATASAVGKYTLLTSAAVAGELQKFEARGWKVRARNAALKKMVFIDEVRLHGMYIALGGDPQKKIYVDQGVLTTRQLLTNIAPMATVSELAALDTGAELACIGISHEGDAVKPDDPHGHDALVPELIACKLFLRTQFDPQSPSSPRLLHLKALHGGNMPANLYGSPIVDRQGKIVAVYAEAAAVGGGNRLRLHYAPMIDPALIERALVESASEGKDAKFWISPPKDVKTGQPPKKTNGSKHK